MDPYLRKIRKIILSINPLMATPGVDLRGTEIHNLRLQLQEEIDYRKNILKLPIEERPELEDENKNIEKLFVEYKDPFKKKLELIGDAIVRFLEECNLDPEEINIVKVLKEVDNEIRRWKHIQTLPQELRPSPDEKHLEQIDSWFVKYFDGRITEISLEV